MYLALMPRLMLLITAAVLALMALAPARAAQAPADKIEHLIVIYEETTVSIITSGTFPVPTASTMPTPLLCNSTSRA